MSEQYRCTSCGYVLDVAEMQCAECNGGRFERLRWTKGGDGSHWEGCAEAHLDCRIAQLEAELARRDADIVTLNYLLTDGVILNGELVEKVESRDEIIERLKEDGERLAKYCQHIPMPDTTCRMSSSGTWNCKCGATEAFHIHRKLMKELEND